MLRLLLLLVVFAAPAFSFTDLKIKTISHSTTDFGQFHNWNDERTVYLQGENRRTELVGFVGTSAADSSMPMPHMALIQQCASRHGLDIDLDHHEYVEEKLPRYPSERDYEKRVKEARQKAREQPVQPPTVRIESNTVDTGETKTIFGHKARHFITTIKDTPLVEGRSGDEERIVDGWYFDIPAPVSTCEPAYMAARQGISVAVFLTSSLESPIRPEVHHTGPVVNGFPVRLKITSHKIDKSSGTPTVQNTTIETEVVEFSEEPLSPSLFEVPSGFKRVKRLYQHGDISQPSVK
jgi:hypothetical protein